MHFLGVKPKKDRANEQFVHKFFSCATNIFLIGTISNFQIDKLYSTLANQ
jgi:hypothetical protein